MFSLFDKLDCATAKEWDIISPKTIAKEDFAKRNLFKIIQETKRIY